MRLRALSLAAISLLALGGRRPLSAQSCGPGPTALVLSGGGVKGLAHLGVLAVLDSLGVRPDLIVGTSMGAIVGAMYASGYSARQIDSLARGLPISEIVRPFRVPAPHPWDERLPILFMVRGRRGFEFQTGIVDEAQPNARLNTAMLRGNLLARGRFDRLPIPFRAVATDLRNRHTVVISEGDLARAVRASSAIPLVFPPVVAGRAILVDGGLSANIPITEARLAGAGRVIVSDVTEHPAENLDPESPIEMADQLLNFLFQQPTGRLGEGDVFIRPDVQEYRSLDFAPETVEEILRRGRAAADTTLTRARCLSTGARPPVPAPPSTLSGWSVRRGMPGDSVLLGRILGLESGPIDAPELRRRLLGLADAEAYRGVWLNPAGTGDSVTFGIEPIRAPRMVGGMGLAYDQDLGGRVWLGIFDRRLLGSTLEASAVGSAGSHQQALEGSLSWHAGLGVSGVSPILTARIRNESVLRFDSAGADLPSLGTSDARVQAGLEVRLGEAWRLRITGDAVAWGTASTRGAARPGASLRVVRSAVSGWQVGGEALVTGPFQSARLIGSRRIQHRRWTIQPLVRLGWSEDAPPQWTMTLGGDDGFPGLHQGERRGAREAAGSLRLGFSVAGPLEARVLLAGGRSWTPGGAGMDDWLGGARFGLGADTPAGPVDVGYGFNSAGRGTFYLRLGQWF